MATVKPFQGLRPEPKLAQKVAALPYDVMDSEEARVLTTENPISFLRVTKSEVDLSPGVDVHSAEVYEKAKQNLDLFIKQGYLKQDVEPCFYIYKQKMGSHIQVGLVAAASVDEYEKEVIKKHELTRPDKEKDRVDHIVATSAQTGAVFLTYREDTAVDVLIEKEMKKDPVYDFVSSDGIAHTFYVVDEERSIKAIEEAFQHIEVLYIADGHHRSAAALRVRDLCKKNNPQHTGEEDYNYFLTVIFPHSMMQIMDYNRVVQDLNGKLAEEFLMAVAEKFVVEGYCKGPFKPSGPHDFGMYLGGSWYKLTAKPEAVAAKDPVASLDISILQNYLLAPILGIEDPRTDQRIHFVGGIRGMGELEKLVDNGKYAVAFSLYPTSIEELMAIADAGQIMPPKSTWFEPKLRDAMAVHLIAPKK